MLDCYFCIKHILMLKACLNRVASVREKNLENEKCCRSDREFWFCSGKFRKMISLRILEFFPEIAIDLAAF